MYRVTEIYKTLVEHFDIEEFTRDAVAEARSMYVPDYYWNSFEDSDGNHHVIVARSHHGDGSTTFVATKIG